MSFSSEKEPVLLQGPAGCLHAQIPGVLVLPPLHYRWEQEHPEAPLPTPQGTAWPMAGEGRGSQHHGDQAQKVPAPAPKKASSSGSASLLR